MPDSPSAKAASACWPTSSASPTWRAASKPSGAATSFRAFVEYLESEYESGDTGEAPVLEQEGGGVQLMTVHKAKGLEFPVVILADLTAKLTGPQGGDRYSDPDRRLCAQRLLWCAPWELLDAAEDEAQADEEEALRVAYVAATRARDLLVVAAIGEEDRQGGWLSPLHDALYPPQGALAHRRNRRRAARSSAARRCSIGRPRQPEEVSVKPGLHYPKAGGHTVVWFDPAVLALRVREGGGRGERAGAQRHDRSRPWRACAAMRNGERRARSGWQAGAAAALSRGLRRDVRLRCGGGADSGRDHHAAARCRAVPPEGNSAGWCTIFCSMPFRPADAAAMAEVWGRWHGASEEECAAAAVAARQALEYCAQAMPAGGRAPSRTAGDGARCRTERWWTAASISPGATANSWTVVDYKTDRREKRNVAQVQLYALALQRATGVPARGIVLEV